MYIFIFTEHLWLLFVLSTSLLTLLNSYCLQNFIHFSHPSSDQGHWHFGFDNLPTVHAMSRLSKLKAISVIFNSWLFRSWSPRGILTQEPPTMFLSLTKNLPQSNGHFFQTPIFLWTKLLSILLPFKYITVNGDVYYTAIMTTSLDRKKKSKVKWQGSKIHSFYAFASRPCQIVSWPQKQFHDMEIECSFLIAPSTYFKMPVFVTKQYVSQQIIIYNLGQKKWQFEILYSL